MTHPKLLGLSLITAFCMLPMQVALGQFAGGSGTAGDPYQIATAAQLSMADDALAYYNSHFILISDIDCSTDPCYPLWPRPNQGTRKDGIGTFGGAQGFGGTFDGQNFSILNRTNSFLNTQRSPTGAGAAPPIFKNIVLSNVFIRPHFLVQLEGRTAAVMPSMYPGTRRTFLNIHAYGTVTNSGISGGLIGGGEDVTVSNCTFTGSVFGGGNTGGLIGSMIGESTVMVSTATADVRHTSTGGGGLVGFLGGDAMLDQCSAGGDVTKVGSIEYTGGLVGLVKGNVTIRECFATGDIIRSGGQAAGLVGGVEGGFTVLIQDCYSTGNNTSTVTMGPGRNGGFVSNFGRSIGSGTHLINRCYSKGDVGSASGGGFMGRDSGGGNAARVMISNSFTSGSTAANNSAGFANSSGFGVTIGNCYWTNSATSDLNATKVANEAYFYNFANAPLDTWDFVTVWGFDGASDPCLQWQSAGCLPAVLPDVGTVVIIR